MKNLAVVATMLFFVAMFLDGNVTSTHAQGTTPTATSSRLINGTPTITSTKIVTATLPVTLTATFTTTRRVTTTATSTSTATVTATATFTPTSTITPTIAMPTPRYPLSLDARVLAIDTLRSQNYRGGQIKITQTLASDEAFQRVLFEYPSDNLRITGMMNIPRGAGPFPVVILNHGYFKPSEYKTGDGTLRAADNFARRGYLTLASDYRCYAGSQCGANPIYVGYAVDVLSLIGALPSLSYADTSRIGIWGHSMGGQITLRVLTLNNSIKVASLYGALTGDDEVHYCWLYGCRTPLVTPAPRDSQAFQDLLPRSLEGMPTPSANSNARLHDIFLRSSPSRYLQYVDAAVIIHHGEKDEIVPREWSVQLSDALNARGKPVSMYLYPDAGHVFTGWDWQLFMARTLAFFDEQLKPRETPITVERRVLRQERLALEASY
ncbi:MAG: prolyl oligopeptidase family serine peptidase [Chloroflexi bacterium]|nr:prolyl oligopeptidase family serine peptidase [Chloroflexota bacterium]